MLTLLINESNPLDGLFANSTTGGVGAVPDITVADAGQAVSVQSFTRAGGIITDSFVAGDALHIGIGDGVNAPVCYVALSSASPATGTMPINTAGMVALFAATAANQLSLTLAVVRTRGAYTNTIFSAPIVIRRSAINISTAVPTPSILGTGVAAALQVAINTALGFVRLDASARLPAVDGSQLTNLPNTGVTSITGTANEITVTGTTTPTLSLPSALTFTAKTITGGTFASPSLTTPTIGDGTESAPSLSFTSDTNTGLYRPTADTVGIVGGGHDILRLTDVASATDYLEIKNGIGVGSPLHVLAEGASANIGVHLQPKGSGLFTISDGTDFNKGIRFRSSSSAASAITLLDAVSTAGRVITLPDATGTLALVSGALGTPASGDFSTGAFIWPTFDQNTTGSAATLTTTRTIGGADFNGSADVTSFPSPGPIGGTTPNTIAGTTGTFSGDLITTGTNAQIYTSGAAAYLATYGDAAHIYTDGANAQIYTSGLNARIATGGANAHISTGSSGAYIQTRSTFKLAGATFITTLSHAATADRAIAFPDAAGTLLLADGSGANLTALNASNVSSGTLADARLSANVPLKDAANTFTAANTISTAGANNAAPLILTGALNTGGTGTTTFPHIFHQPTGATAATTWSSGANSGTVFGANESTGFTGNFVDFRVAGSIATNYFAVSSAGLVGTSGAFYIKPNAGFTTFNAAWGGGSMPVSSGWSMQWAASSTQAEGTKDLILSRQAANILQIGTSSANALGSLGCLNIVAGGTLAVTGATTLTGNLTSNGALISTPQALTGAGAVNVTTLTTAVTTTAPAQALTLANGTNGQIKTIVHQALSGGGTWVLTPTTKTGYTTITSTAVGETCTLQFFTTIGWCILSLRGAIAA